MAGLTAIVVTTEYNLKLTEQEAIVLAALLGSILGNPETSPRRECDSIFNALTSQITLDQLQPVDKLRRGEITFDYYKKEDAQ